jgi:hypothetical protein
MVVRTVIIIVEATSLSGRQNYVTMATTRSVACSRHGAMKEPKADATWVENAYSRLLTAPYGLVVVRMRGRIEKQWRSEHLQVCMTTSVEPWQGKYPWVQSGDAPTSPISKQSRNAKNLQATRQHRWKEFSLSALISGGAYRDYRRPINLIREVDGDDDGDDDGPPLNDTDS